MKIKEDFIEWNAERLSISLEESAARLEVSNKAHNGGHRGRPYRDFCDIMYRTMEVFFSDTPEEVYESYKLHSYLHMLRQLSLGDKPIDSNNEIVKLAESVEKLTILDYGCGMAQTSFELARFYKNLNIDVTLYLVDIPTLKKNFHLWRGRKHNISVTHLDASIDQPIPELPKCDIVIATEFFEHVYQPVNYLKSIDNVLVPGGVMLTNVSDHHKEFQHVSPDLSDLRSFLNTGYREVQKNTLYKKLYEN